MQSLRTSIILAALAAFARAAVLVNLDATDKPLGALPTWINTGIVAGNFTSSGGITPNVASVSTGSGTVNAVQLSGTLNWYTGPVAPAAITGTNFPRTIEAWVMNPSLVAEETIIAWGRRGGPDGTNCAFNYGSSTVFGAVGHWGAPDMGWHSSGAASPAAGQWHYLVYTYDGSTVTLYVDGVQTNSKAVALNTHGGTLPFAVGTQNNADGTRSQQGFNGSMNIGRIRVHDELLTAAQIEAQYFSEGPTFGRAQPTITSFTASTLSSLPGQGVTLSWNVLGATSLSINQGIGAVPIPSGTVTVTPTTTTTYTLTATNAAGSATANVTIVPQVPITLRNRWRFNEAAGAAANGAQVSDSVSAAHGTIRGTGATFTGTQVSLPGGASGSAPYIDLPNGLLSSLNEITLEGWMTLNGTQNWSRYFDFGTGTAGELFAPGGTANGTEYLLLSAQVGANNALRRFEIRDNNLPQTIDLADTTTYGTQFHFAVVYNATANGGSPLLSYYKNGTLIGTLPTTYRLQDISDVNNWLGRSNWTADNNTQASYNEFRIWNGALSPGAIADSTAAGPDTLPQQPRIDAFTAIPAATIYRGDTVRLSYILGDPASLGITASIDNGVGAVTTPSGFVDVTPASNTTYQLTVTNSAGSRSATTTITVLPSEPAAQNANVSTAYQTPLNITLPVTDPNTPASSLTYTILSGPSHGSISGGTEQNRTYTPANGFSGTDTFTFKANDGISDSNTATVTITVFPPPSAPTDIIPSETRIETSAISGSFISRLRPVDPNPTDTFTLTLVSGSGDTHNNLFTIAGNQLISAHNFSDDLGQVISVRVRVTDNTGRSFEKQITFPVSSPDLRVKINEIHYNPSRNVLLGEFIELYNPTASAVDMSGWRFDAGVDFIFPPGTSIPAGGYLVIADDPPTLAAMYGITALGPWSGGLNSQGEEIILRDQFGNKVDGVEYGITSPWPATPNGDGPTLELIHPSLDNDFGGNWRASTVTPAAVSYIAPGSPGWSYRKGTSEASSPTGLWHNETFALDGSWLSGTAPIGLYKKNNNIPLATNAESGVTLGTQLTDMATYLSSSAPSGTNYSLSYSSVYFRKTFSVAGTIPKHLLLRVQHNDAAIVWLNGIEVARFGFPPGSTGDVAFNSTAFYERGNDPWSELIIADADTVLHPGTNTLAIHGFAKAPHTRSTQEDIGQYNVFDFSIDAALTSVPDILGTPGAQNSVFSTASPPAVRSISHSPKQPSSTTPIVVSAKISDPQGVGPVTLSYQIVAPGNFIPSTLPLTNGQILANPLQELPPNPAFESTANWTTIPMVDDASVPGDIAGDGEFTAIIPAQPGRTLVRYRITATDLTGQQARYPSASDPRKNFAAFVYDGVPAYIAGSQSFTPATLTTLPVYHWLTRASDFSSLLAYNSAEQFANLPDLNVLLARRFENFEGALVVGDQVIDHALIRLRGGNSRYMGTGKRHFRFIFPKGTPLQAADEAGRKYPRAWEDMLFNKLFGNKGYYDWGLPYEIGAKMWALSGIPMPESHWVHFRVIRDANQNHASLGDFWGLYQALEYPDGPNFLAARGLPRGNFYKMSDWMQNGEMAERSQAPGAVDFGEDFDNIRYNIHQTTSNAYIEQYVNMPLYYRYDAVKEAIRHYDLFVEPTGRHRVKNLIWYFQPQPGNLLGKLITMPYDWDASFGPNWNNGWDVFHNAIYDHFDVPDSPTWMLPKQTPRTLMAIEHRNAIRELRDLLVYRDGTGRGPMDDMIDDAAATITAFYPADMARWPATGAQANFPGGVPAKVADMKAFLFSGWTDTAGNGDPPVGAGGRAAYLDTISDALDAGQLPATPTITYSGAPGNPVDGIALTSSAFSDPQGAGTFGAMQWRIGEITDPAAPAYDPAAERIYEITQVWGSGEISPFSASITVPAGALRVGRTYRARVRHKDNTGRWSHWSQPVTFTTTTSNYVQVLRDNLMITEVMYHPAPPTPADAGNGWIEEDFEYVELTNISSTLTLDLANVRFTKGVDFDFAGSAITSLAPGQRVLVVRNTAAFTARYGAGKPIAGVWETGDVLSNAGEQLKLSFGAGSPIHDFTYDDNAPWPPQADLGGYSLVLINPSSAPDHALPASWRASSRIGGTPGENGIIFSEWAAANGVTTPAGNGDGDALNDLLEYALAGNPTANSQLPLPARAVQSLDVGGNVGNYLTLTFTRQTAAEDLAYFVDFATALPAWNPVGVLVTSTSNPDGTVTETWRSPWPLSAEPVQFGRVRFSIP